MFPEGIPPSKRLLDLALTIPAMLVLIPLQALIFVLVWIFIGWPVLFRQERPGYKGKPITVIKFRTMTDARDAHGRLLPDEQRMTRLGNFLRAYSLDELPEFFLVLQGKMSLVGPRPLLTQYLERYSPEQARRHNVLPGITGWAQINGRNAVSWEEKFRLDVWYVDHWSLWLDLKILAITLLKVIRREGVNQPGYATAEEFMGNPESKAESKENAG